MTHTSHIMDGHRAEPLAPLGKSPLVDIVSYGYKLTVKSLWPITMLTAPGILLYGVSIAFLKASGLETYKVTHVMPTPWVVFTGLGLLILVALPVLAYSSYALMRYIRNLFRESSEQTLLSCFIPDWTLLGCFLLMLLTCFAAIPALIVTVIGLVLLIVPGIIFLNAYSTMIWVVYAVYLQMPYQGASGAMSNIFESIGRAFTLLKGNLWRAVGIGVLCGLINIVLQGMTRVPSVILGVLEAFSPNLVHNPVYLSAYGLMMGFQMWFSVSLCMAAQIAVIYRFVCDLEARAAEVAPAEMHVHRRPDIVSS